MSLKYCILEKLEELPNRIYKQKSKEIPIALGKVKRTFERYCVLTIEDQGDISVIDLDIIASCLGCSSEELKNFVIVNGELKMKTKRKSS